MRIPNGSLNSTFSPSFCELTFGCVFAPDYLAETNPVTPFLFLLIILINSEELVSLGI